MKIIFISVLLSIVASLAFAKAPVVPKGQSFDCTPTHVWDGDGPVWCSEGPKVRVSGINARETDGTCKEGHPCPGLDATWEMARDHLVSLVGTPTGRKSKHGHIIVHGPTMQCISVGRAGRDRTGAWCVSPRGGDISCAMIKSGLVVKWKTYWKQHNCSD